MFYVLYILYIYNNTIIIQYWITLIQLWHVTCGCQISEILTKTNVSVVCIDFVTWSFTLGADGDADAIEQQDRVCDQGTTESQFCASEDPQRSSTQKEGKKIMITVHPASPIPQEKPRVPVRVRKKQCLNPQWEEAEAIPHREKNSRVAFPKLKCFPQK